MNCLKFATLAAALTSALFLAQPAFAVVWVESGAGAGETLATAEVTIGTQSQPLTDIFGTLDTVLRVNSLPRNQVDVYRIFVNDFASFSARTVSSNPDDTALFLFDSAGKGVYTNDDNAGDLLSTLPPGGPQTNDFYYIAVSVGGFSARDAASNNVFLSGSFTDVLAGNPAAGSLASWDEGFATLTEAGLPYDIALTGALVAVIPEPPTVLLLLVGMGGLLGSRSMRRPAKPGLSDAGPVEPVVAVGTAAA